MKDLDWMIEAKKHLNLAEISGSKHNPTIVQWLRDLKSGWLDDETAWCGTFIAHCLQVAGFTKGTVDSRKKGWKGEKAGYGQYPYNWYGALDYSREGGVKLDKPAYGCVAVKTRKGGGHVTFIVGRDVKTGKLVGLGGNQSNKVCYALYADTEFTHFMWYGKTGSPAPERYNLPKLSGVTASKVSEA